MSYSVRPGSISGRIGSELGKGLAEQIPKEVERNRLSSGLEALSKEKGLTPFQQLGKLATLPGVTPQLIQSGAELLRQEGRAGALKEKAGPGQALIDKANSAQGQRTRGASGNTPSVTTAKGIEATTKPYIPKTFEQLQQRAGELLRDNPALFQGDDAKAMQAAQAEDSQNQAINQAYQGQRKGEQDVQTRIENELDKQHQTLGANVPGNTFSDIQDKAIEAVKSGVTELQAAKKAGKELDDISKDYKAIDTLGDWGVLSRSPSKNRSILKSLRYKFKERGDAELENFANTMIAKNGLSPPKAYTVAFPVSDIKELNNAIMNLPKIDHVNFKKGYPEFAQNVSDKTLKIAPKIAATMGNDGSPLSIATELQARGYDPDVWMDYVDKNRKNLKLSERQAQELQHRDFTNTLNDVWLFIFSGLDKLVEQ